MSSSFKYTLTKLRSLPWSLYRCALRPECRFVRSASSSPMVAPWASTASCLSVYGRSGVGIRIFVVAIQGALIKTGSVFLQKPDGHIARRARHHRDNHISKVRPRVIEIELRRPRRMIRVRVVEAKQLAAERRGLSFGGPIVGRPHQKPAARSFLGCVWQRHRGGDRVAGPDKGAATLVRKGLLAMTTDRAGDAGVQIAAAHVSPRTSRTFRSGTSQRRPETP